MPNVDYAYPESYSGLTKDGKRQMYDFGREMAKMYYKYNGNSCPLNKLLQTSERYSEYSKNLNFNLSASKSFETLKDVTN